MNHTATQTIYCDWIQNACGQWTPEDCVDEIVTDENGEQRFCPKCVVLIVVPQNVRRYFAFSFHQQNSFYAWKLIFMHENTASYYWCRKSCTLASLVDNRYIVYIYEVDNTYRWSINGQTIPP